MYIKVYKKIIIDYKSLGAGGTTTKPRKPPLDLMRPHDGHHCLQGLSKHTIVMERIRPRPNLCLTQKSNNLR